jgi:glycosyltransferase involved in cell wall biosynthesis
MKILHAVLSEGFYGSERYCAELAASQARDGHDIEIIVHGAWSDCAREMRKAVALANTVGAGTLRLVTIPSWMPAFLHRVVARIALRLFRPDIVHTHLNPAARRVGRVAQRFNIPHVATLHLSYAKREVGDCDGLICVAGWQLDTLEGFGGEVMVVHNWIPLTVFDALLETTIQQIGSLRQSWNADPETYVFGSVGRLVPEKGIDQLVEIFRHLFPNGDENVRLVIVGDGPDRAQIESLAQRDPRIFFAGARQNVADYYRAFDIYVSPARFEPFGLSILEAMAAGCPLVLTRSEGPSEFVTDPRVRWAELGDNARLAEQIVASMESAHHRITYDMKPFSPERATEQIAAFYRRVIKRREQRTTT